MRKWTECPAVLGKKRMVDINVSSVFVATVAMPPITPSNQKVLIYRSRLLECRLLY